MYNTIKLVPVGLFLLCSNWCSSIPIQQTTFAQIPEVDFPVVNNNEIIGLDVDGLTVSNDSNYIYLCNQQTDDCEIIDQVHLQPVTPLIPQGNPSAYWSIDNSKLITSVVGNDCQVSPNEKSNVIFDTSSHTLSSICLEDYIITSNWSPISPDMLLLGSGKLLNTSTFDVTEFSAPSEVEILNLDDYVGYGNKLWDPSTGYPVAEMNLHEVYQLGEITESTIQVCTLALQDCADFLNTLSVSNVDVFSISLHQHWMLWAGHLSASGQAISNEFDPSNRSDSILYMTYLPTGETQELFQFSSLSRSDLYIKQIAWSPDAKTIALSLGIFNPPTPPPPSSEMNAPSFDAGILLLHLDWPESVTTTSTHTYVSQNSASG